MLEIVMSYKLFVKSPYAVGDLIYVASLVAYPSPSLLYSLVREFAEDKCMCISEVVIKQGRRTCLSTSVDSFKYC